MGPDDGRVDHEVLVARVGRQDLENLFPNARLGPASKALLVGAFPVAVALGKMAPVGPALRKTHKQPLTKARLSAAVLPRSPALPGSRDP